MNSYDANTSMHPVITVTAFTSCSFCNWCPGLSFISPYGQPRSTYPPSSSCAQIVRLPLVSCYKSVLSKQTSETLINEDSYNNLHCYHCRGECFLFHHRACLRKTGISKKENYSVQAVNLQGFRMPLCPITCNRFFTLHRLTTP